MEDNKDKFGIYGITIGIVKATDDGGQNGRLQVYCPSIDYEDYNIDDLPWAEYASPFAGSISNMVAGPDRSTTNGPRAYGFWAIPKVGAQVIIFFLEGNSNFRYWSHQLYPIQSNRSLPGGQALPGGPFSDTGSPIEPLASNLATAGLSNDKLRGYYERQAAQPLTNKNGAEGYSTNPSANDGSLDPQTYSWTTPGGHMLTMQDDPDFCRMRFRTTSGNQIIMDDNNGFIYVSGAKGNTWFELNDATGQVYCYGAQSFSVHAGNEINLKAESNINLEAGGAINLKSTGAINLDSPSTINIKAGGSILATATQSLDLKGTVGVKIQSLTTLDLTGAAGVLVTGATIQLNGPPAQFPTDAGPATGVTIIPDHEPWTR